MVRITNATGPGEQATVIVTGGEHLSVLGAVRALRDAGHEPWVAVHERGTYTARSRATAGIIEAPDPAEDPAGFADAIAAGAARTGASVVLPGTEQGMVALARHADVFPTSVVLGIPTVSTIAEVTDKRRLGALARSVGLGTPPTAELDLDTTPEELPFDLPVVVKPHRSELADEQGVIRHHATRAASSFDDVRAALAELPGQRGLVQPFMVGPLGSLAGVAWDGRLVAAVQARADRVWPAPCGSISHAVTVPLDGDLAGAIERLLRSVGWNGIFQVDLFEEAGGYALIDLNPRLYTSLAHATKAGVNLPAIWVDLLLGRTPTAADTYRVGLHYRHEEGDIRALGRMLLRGQRSDALRGLLPRGEIAYAVYAPGDRGPLVTSLSRMLRRTTRARRDKDTPPLVGGTGKATA